MDQNTDKNQKIPGTDQISATPGGKESAPSEIGGEQNPLTEFATHKEPEISEELKGVVTPVSTPSIQRTVDEVLPAGKQNSSVQSTSEVSIAEEGNIGLGITWLNAIKSKLESLRSLFKGSKPNEPVKI
ncbi:MAG: hypothetical protein A3A51_00580 [Candidatus Levybacteria bacterium RIFCSPLOWO2_01_FULL_39_10]|nr:MAG: hypothetical protein A3A51_00580 [Candidatus Levybacteria bacterium RIFCSPLOWO2_01_FULL_39_10]